MARWRVPRGGSNGCLHYCSTGRPEGGYAGRFVSCARYNSGLGKRGRTQADGARNDISHAVRELSTCRVE